MRQDSGMGTLAKGLRSSQEDVGAVRAPERDRRQVPGPTAWRQLEWEMRRLKGGGWMRRSQRGGRGLPAPRPELQGLAGLG